MAMKAFCRGSGKKDEIQGATCDRGAAQDVKDAAGSRFSLKPLTLTTSHPNNASNITRQMQLNFQPSKLAAPEDKPSKFTGPGDNPLHPGATDNSMFKHGATGSSKSKLTASGEQPKARCPQNEPAKASPPAEQLKACPSGNHKANPEAAKPKSSLFGSKAAAQQSAAAKAAPHAQATLPANALSTAKDAAPRTVAHTPIGHQLPAPGHFLTRPVEYTLKDGAAGSVDMKHAPGQPQDSSVHKQPHLLALTGSMKPEKLHLLKFSSNIKPPHLAFVGVDGTSSVQQGNPHDAAKAKALTGTETAVAVAGPKKRQLPPLPLLYTNSKPSANNTEQAIDKLQQPGPCLHMSASNLAKVQVTAGKGMALMHGIDKLPGTQSAPTNAHASLGTTEGRQDNKLDFPRKGVIQCKDMPAAVTKASSQLHRKDRTSGLDSDQHVMSDKNEDNSTSDGASDYEPVPNKKGAKVSAKPPARRLLVPAAKKLCAAGIAGSTADIDADDGSPTDSDSDYHEDAPKPRAQVQSKAARTAVGPAAKKLQPTMPDKATIKGKNKAQKPEDDVSDMDHDSTDKQPALPSTVATKGKAGTRNQAARPTKAPKSVDIAGATALNMQQLAATATKAATIPCLVLKPLTKPAGGSSTPAEDKDAYDPDRDDDIISADQDQDTQISDKDEDDADLLMSNQDDDISDSQSDLYESSDGQSDSDYSEDKSKKQRKDPAKPAAFKTRKGDTIKMDDQHFLLDGLTAQDGKPPVTKTKVKVKQAVANTSIDIVKGEIPLLLPSMAALQSATTATTLLQLPGGEDFEGDVGVIGRCVDLMAGNDEGFGCADRVALDLKGCIYKLGTVRLMGSCALFKISAAGGQATSATIEKLFTHITIATEDDQANAMAMDADDAYGVMSSDEEGMFEAAHKLNAAGVGGNVEEGCVKKNKKGGRKAGQPAAAKKAATAGTKRKPAARRKPATKKAKK